MGHAVLRVLGFLSLILYCEPAQDALLTIEPNWSTLFTGESVTFMCDMREGNDNDWIYTIMRDGRTFLPFNGHKNYTSPLTTVYSGEYHCVGDYKWSRSLRKESNKVSLTISDKDVILQTPASTLFRGESVTLRCRDRDQREEDATFYKNGSLIETEINRQNTFEVTTSPTSTESSYSCKFEDEESEAVKLKMQPRPKARLSKGYERNNVTLTCSVGPSSPPSSSSSSGWKYFWYRRDISSEPLTTQDYILLSNGQIHVSQRGLYWCRGGRGNPVFYTEYSEVISVKIRPVVTLQPNWPELYSGETITLVCLVEDGGDTEWEYEWETPNSYRPQNPRGHMIRSSLSGKYGCRGRSKKYKMFTDWSDAFTLKLDSNKPKPDLTVSPSWLSPGASVTLNCSVQHPSAGWRFYWYKAVPKPSESSYNSYSYELLPGSTIGTEPYIVHGQTHMAGYMCRAERGDPVYSTHYSDTKFVWSGDFNPAASLSVSPDRVQHFSEESPSLSCEGNSTEWRVSRFSLYGAPSYCTTWGTMTGSTCIMNQTRISGVYWCESGTGQFSNAVNITVNYDDVILVSPALPVAEGRPVTLGCKSKTDEALSNVDFYKNGKLLPNQGRGELAISAVSKSDEGLYRCEALNRWRQKSPESWMSVKFHSDVSVPGSEQSSPLPVALITGLVCGVLMIMILLLGLYHCRKSKYSSFMSRSQSTNQSPAVDDITNQVETRHKDYPSPLHGDAVLFESISVSGEPKHDESIDVTYSVVELKKLARKGKNNKPEESTVYSSVAMASAADDNLMYAEVHAHTEAKKDKGKSSPAAADQTVYSELKPKTAPR